MRYMVMHKTDTKMEAGERPSGELLANMGKFIGDNLKSGVFKDGAGLHRSAQRARVAKGKVTKGPFTEGRELTSFKQIEADSLDHACELAGKLSDGEVEVGPVVEQWDLQGKPAPAGAPKRFLLLADRPLPGGTVLAGTDKGARYRKRGGKREWIDGPFTEAKELIAGFSIVELPSLAAAKQWAEAYADILGDNEVDVRTVR